MGKPNAIQSSTAKNSNGQPAIDEYVIEGSIKAVQKAFATLFGEIVAPGTPQRLPPDSANDSDIAGVIGMVQESIDATMFLSFHKKTIFAVLGKFYGREFTSIDTSVHQGVAEITNIIYGQLKEHLNKHGHSFKMALPGVILGNHRYIIPMSDTRSIMIPFKTESGTFSIEVRMHGTFSTAE